MTRSPKLTGTFTALVTPMNQDGSLDLAALDQLVDQQLAHNVEGLVPCGTTGESPTLSAQERETVIGRVVKRVAGRVPVIAGTGANSTSAAIEQQKRARDTGATHTLVVTPYYNRPTPEGLYRHYAAICAAVELPIILYNVPSRTGCDMSPDTVARLSKLTGVVGIKEATGEIDRVAAIRDKTSTDFAILSGDDGTTCPFVLMGGDGVICVASNLVPTAMGDMVRAALAGNVATACAQHLRLRPLFRALALESNPIPIKAALATSGLVQEIYRLPLCEMSAEAKARLLAVLAAGGWGR